MDVIPLIVTEEDVINLPAGLLSKLATCSTEVIKDRVKAYLAKPEALPEVKEKISKAYQVQFTRDAYLTDEQVIADVQRVKDLNYADINPSISEKTLHQYEEIIQGILTNPNSAAYVAPIDSVYIRTLVEEIQIYAKGADIPSLKGLSLRLKENSRLFKDAQSKGHTGTPMKRIMTNIRKYEILLEGIRFLLRKKAAGTEPAQWRIL